MALHIARLTDDRIAAAKDVFIRGCLEFFGQPPVQCEDLDTTSTQYSEPSGIFLVLLDGDQVVGTGAIRRLDPQTCELKRLWFLPAYRGQGHGRQMLAQLLAFAASAGCQRIRLDTAPELQAANRLYRRLGFYLIERYNDGPATIFMEKILSSAQV